MRPDVIRHSAEGWIGEPEIPDFYLFIRTEGFTNQRWGRLHNSDLSVVVFTVKRPVTPVHPLFPFWLEFLHRSASGIRSEAYRTHLQPRLSDCRESNRVMP